jgi:hypothetical protein
LSQEYEAIPGGLARPVSKVHVSKIVHHPHVVIVRHGFGSRSGVRLARTMRKFFRPWQYTSPCVVSYITLPIDRPISLAYPRVRERFELFNLLETFSAVSCAAIEFAAHSVAREATTYSVP